jgi:hypothetical protein
MDFLCHLGLVSMIFTDSYIVACHLGKMDFYAILPNGFLCQNGNFSWRARFLGWPGKNLSHQAKQLPPPLCK